MSVKLAQSGRNLAQSVKLGVHQAEKDTNRKYYTDVHFIRTNTKEKRETFRNRKIRG